MQDFLNLIIKFVSSIYHIPHLFLKFILKAILLLFLNAKYELYVLQNLINWILNFNLMNEYHLTIKLFNYLIVCTSNPVSNIYFCIFIITFQLNHHHNHFKNLIIMIFYQKSFYHFI